MSELVWHEGRWWEQHGNCLYYIYTREEVVRIGSKLLAELRAKSDMIDSLMENENTDFVDGYACPMDPMEALNCEACQ